MGHSDNDDLKLPNNPLKRKIKHDSTIPLKNKSLALKDNEIGTSMEQECNQTEGAGEGSSRSGNVNTQPPLKIYSFLK